MHPLKLLFTIQKKLQAIEQRIGKSSKAKDAPRVIDIDILLFGLERLSQYDLTIPHPCWKERLFVIQPLSDLVKTLAIPTIDGVREIDLFDLKEKFTNPNKEHVVLLSASALISLPSSTDYS